MKTPNLYRVDFKSNSLTYYFVAFSKEEAEVMVKFGLQMSEPSLIYLLPKISEVINHDLDDDILSLLYVFHRCDGEPIFHFSLDDIRKHYFNYSNKFTYNDD